MTPVLEASFLQQVKALAYLHGWAFHHATPSMTSKGKWITTGAVGFPDLVLAHRARGLIFAELKTDLGRLSEHQLDWGEAIVTAGGEYHLWRPQNLQAIAERLGPQ